MYRSATSRAYYCAFQSAMALLVKKNEFQPTGKGSDHAAVIQTYQFSASQVRKQIAKDLVRLKDRRRKADYELAALSDPQFMATKSVETARRILADLNTQ
jgi:uncharacterized protein (UPF0332 family)